MLGLIISGSFFMSAIAANGIPQFATETMRRKRRRRRRRRRRRKQQMDTKEGI